MAAVQTEKQEVDRQLRAASKEKRELEVKLMEADSRTTAAKRLMEEMQAQVQLAAGATAKAAELEKRMTSQALEVRTLMSKGLPQRMALERCTTPTLSRRACSPR